jgi:hypothetical protein
VASRFDNTTEQDVEMTDEKSDADGEVFLEFRRKIQEASILSASLERLLKAIKFTGRVSVVVQNGRVLKSGYEEGYFTRRWDDRQIQ